MPGLYTHTTRATGLTLTASIYNADHQNHIDHLTPAYIDDTSANLAAMQATSDPGEVSAESLATTLQGEIQQLRYAIKETKAAIDSSIAYWYETPISSVVYNVKAYGATGDGSTDDYSALNTLFTTVHTAGGGCVYFPAGTYKITNSLRIPSDTLVYGDGKKTIILMDTSITACAFENWGQNSSATDTNICVRDLSINGNRTTPAGSFTTYESNIWNLSTAYTQGTYTINTSSYRVYYCATSGTSAGVGTGPSGTGTGIADGTCVWNYVEELFTENTIPGGHQAGILFSQVTNCLVTNVHFYMSRDNGAIFELCQNAKFINNHAVDINKNCVYFSNNEHSVCMGNTFRNCWGGAAYACEYYSTMSGNTGQNCINYFITAGRDCQFVSIIGNTAGTSLSGSSGSSSQGDFLVAQESITGTAHGRTYAGSYGQYEYGMYNCVIADNVFTRIQVSMSNRLLIANNQIVNSRKDGLHVLGCSQCTILNNKIYDGGDQTLGPWAVYNGPIAGGSLDGTVQSVQNKYLFNEIYDDRNNNGLVRWGFTFGASSAYLRVEGNLVYLDSDAALAIRYYNWAAGYGVFKNNYYDGSKKFIPQVSAPSASELYRGDLITVNGGAGVLDRHYIFQKNAADAYETTEILPMTAVASWTATGTGFTGSVTASVPYQIVGGVVTCYIPILTGTSNATSFTITGMPAAITPSRTHWMMIHVMDNSVEAIGLLLLTASSTTITLYPSYTSTSTWTNVNTKTLYPLMLSWSLTGF